MTLRIMVWNIQGLSINKFLSSANVDPGQLRQQYITENIARVNPDILVVLEVESGSGGGRGCVVTGTSGGPAILALLYHLRSVDAADQQWCVVPPLILGVAFGGIKEGIAVFFKNTVVDFAGPFQLGQSIYGNTQMGQALGGAAQTYNAPWNAALPASQPIGPAVGNSLKQNQLAGRYQYGQPNNANIPLRFPAAQDRSPYQTIFREKGGAGRTINLFSMHAPSEANKAIQALKQVALIDDIRRSSLANEVQVIAGDFNVNLLNPNELKGYNALTNLNYTLTIHSSPTQLAPIHQASLRGVAPYYGYMSQGPPSNTLTLPDPNFPRKLLDNFLVQPLEGQEGVVVNRVYGTLLPPIPSAMGTPIGALVQSSLLPTQTGDEAGSLQGITNFGKIRGASDHLAIYIDI